MAWFLLVWYFFCSKCLRSQVAVIFHFEIVKFVQFLSCWCWHLLLNKTCVATLHVLFIQHDVTFLNYVTLLCIKDAYDTWSKKKKYEYAFISVAVPESTVRDLEAIIFAHGCSCRDWSCVKGSRDGKISHYSQLQNSPAEICYAGKTSKIK